MKNRFFVFAVSFVVLLAVGFWVLKYSFNPNSDTGSLGGPQVAFAVDHSLLVREHSPIFGDKNAPITIVEFLDPECEACRAMYPITKKVLSEFPGKAKLVIRYMPFHPNSMLAANVLEEARSQGKYWESLELLFKRQPEWADHHDPKPEQIFTILRQLNLDITKLQKAAEDNKYVAEIRQDEYDGKRLGVRQTPSFFINGKFLEQMGEAPLRNAIAAELAK